MANWLTDLYDTGDAALQRFADTASFGLAPKATAALAAGLYRPEGTSFGQRYEAARQLDEERRQQLAASHPYANALGWAGGLLGGGRVLGDVLPAAMTPAATDSRVVSGVKNALAGGAVSGVQNAVENVDNPAYSPADVARDALTSAGVGALAGPVIGYAGGKLLGMASGGLSKGWRAVAGKLGVTPEELTQRVVDFQRRTGGQQPALVDVLPSTASAGAKAFAAKNPDFAAAVQAYSGKADAALPQQMGSVLRANTPSPNLPAYLRGTSDMTPSALTSRQIASGTAVFPALKAQPAGAIPQTIADNDTWMRAVYDAAPTMKPDANTPSVREKVAALMNGQQPSKPMTVDDWDHIRQNVSNYAQSGNKDAHVYRDLNDSIDTWLGGPAGQRTPYGQALDQYAAAGNYQRGFEHGFNGGDAASVPGGSEGSVLRNTLETPEGQRGLAAGQAQAMQRQVGGSVPGAQRFVQTMAQPTTTSAALDLPLGPQGGNAVRQAAQAQAEAAASRQAASGTVPGPQDEAGHISMIPLAHMAVGGPTGALHAIADMAARVLSSSHFSPEVQQRIGLALTSTDPGIRSAALNALAEAGRSSQALASAPAVIGGTAGAQAGRIMAGPYVAGQPTNGSVVGEPQWEEGGTLSPIGDSQSSTGSPPADADWQ